MEIKFSPKGHSKFPLHRQSEKLESASMQGWLVLATLRYISIQQYVFFYQTANIYDQITIMYSISSGYNLKAQRVTWAEWLPATDHCRIYNARTYLKLHYRFSAMFNFQLDNNYYKVNIAGTPLP